jgi:hypothetical protein
MDGLVSIQVGSDWRIIACPHIHCRDLLGGGPRSTSTYTCQCCLSFNIDSGTSVPIVSIMAYIDSQRFSSQRNAQRIGSLVEVDTLAIADR